MATGRPRGRPRKHFPPIVVSDSPAGVINPDAPVVFAFASNGPSEQLQVIEPESTEPEGPQLPDDWHPGMLLSVRNFGDAYTITLWPEEFDPRKPERALRFANPAAAQNFISKWYARQSHDPRAV